MTQINHSKKMYLLLLIGQTISQLGSGMTGFAVVIWAYTQKGSAMVSSILAVCSMMPYLIVSLFGGAVADKFNKKKIMLICDTVAAFGTLCILIFFLSNNLQIWVLYIVNVINGLMNAFQTPASQVSFTLLVNKDDYVKMGGVQSVCSSLASLLKPILASALLAFGGLGLILSIDLFTFFFAFITLAFFIKIPEAVVEENTPSFIDLIHSMKDAVLFLKAKKSIFNLLLCYCILEFLGSIDSIVTPLLLARTNNNEMAVGMVSSFMAIGGLLSGLLLPCIRPKQNKVLIMFTGSFLCFFGIAMMGIGRSIPWFMAFSFIICFGIPIYKTFQMTILREHIPVSLQGRIFSLKGMLSQGLMPVGFILWSSFSDYVFTPFFSKEGKFQDTLSFILGYGKGAALGIVFLILGLCGMLVNVLFYQKNKELNTMQVLKP